MEVFIAHLCRVEPSIGAPLHDRDAFARHLVDGHARVGRLEDFCVCRVRQCYSVSALPWLFNQTKSFFLLNRVSSVCPSCRGKLSQSAEQQGHTWSRHGEEVCIRIDYRWSLRALLLLLQSISSTPSRSRDGDWQHARRDGGSGSGAAGWTRRSVV